MFTVYYQHSRDGYLNVFVCDVPTQKLAETICKHLQDDFKVFRAWAEKD